jgi:Sec-independent protein translocase protein TatA
MAGIGWREIAVIIVVALVILAVAKLRSRSG